MNKPANNVKNQKSFAQRKSETHTRCNVWVENGQLEQIKAIAEAQGFMNRTGSKTGQVNLGETMGYVLEVGLKAINQQNSESAGGGKKGAR